jgi:hypothetical protein
MVKKSEEIKDIHKDIHTEKKDGFKTCEDSYTAVHLNYHYTLSRIIQYMKNIFEQILFCSIR